MTAHALLSPSSAERWLSCTPSARMESKLPDTAKEAAAEGTLAHALSELFVRKALKLIKLHVYEKELNVIQQNDLYNHSMDDHAESYSVFVMERFCEAQAHTKDALIFLEQKLNLTDYIKEGFGTGDAVIIADRVLDIIDMKYGKGVTVSAENNKQMMLYALGALREFDYMYDIQVVRMTIFQPRIDNYSSWEIQVNDLRRWAEEELKPRAELAFAGLGDFNAGKHCRFCKAAATCKANADMNMELAKYDFTEAGLLTDEEVVDILDRADAFVKWLAAVEAYTLDQAVNNNKKWPGYKLVEGRGDRKYTDETLITEKLTKEGFELDVISPRKLLGITKMTKEIGKNKFDSLITPFLVKPPGKLTLVPLSDKRPEHNTSEGAKKDFETV